MSAATLFRALGDEQRWTLLQRLGPAPKRLGELAEGLDITRQAVRKHLDVLAEANLVTLRPVGRTTMVEPNARAIAQARQELDLLSQRWDERLVRLKRHLEGG